jgi:Apolipoprotein A1/A4/E domain
MANNPQKSKDASKDPTEQAISAIEDALNVRDPDLRIEPSFRDGEANEPARDASRHSAPMSADLFHEPEQPSLWASDDSAPRQPANDDRANMGVILQTLRRRRARAPYVIASIAALGWIAGGAALAALSSAELQALLATPRIGLAVAAGIASAMVVPIIFFYVIAHMFSRSQDMRLVAESMAEVAMRLAQPESAAREQIVSVGQAVRREVAAMGDGVERALARAAELEALVHNEVSALERAYNDNEVRIRDLLSELTNQRDTLVSQSEQVRKAIGSVHLDLSHDITSVGDLVAEKVNEVAQRVTRSLTEKGEHITLALGHAGDSMIDALSERGSSLLDRLETTSDKTTTAISSASDRLSDSLNFKTEHVHDEFADLAARLQQMMTSRLDLVASSFAEKTQGTIETMASRSTLFTHAITETGDRMAEQIAARAGDVNQTLRSTGDSLVLDLSMRGGDVVSKLEQTGIHITDMLAARLQAFDATFNQGGTELSEKIARDSSTLGSLITRHITEFDHTVKTYGGELVERLGKRTQDVADAMRTYLDSFDQRVTTRTDDLSGTLDSRLTAFESMLGGRVTELATTLTEGGKDMVGALDKRIGDVTGTINTRGAEVADAISAKIGEMDKTLGNRAMEVAGTLDSRIGRFEELLVGRAVTVTDQIETRTKAAAEALTSRMEQLSQAIKTNSTEAQQSLGALALSTTDAIRTSAAEAERTLTGVSDEVARSFTTRADEIANTVSQRTSEMTEILSDKSGGVLHAIVEKGEKFAADITKATETAMSSIEDKGLVFSRSVMDNGTEITRMINVAGESAANSVTRTLNELQDTAGRAIEKSKATATATVGEMMETHNMLRADTTALFERLREANIMLQEVLSGSHENMSALENTLMLRVSEFVTAMNEVTATTGEATNRVENNIANFREITTHVVTDLGQLAGQFDQHGRELAVAASQIDQSNRRTEDTVNERRAQIDSLISTLDIRTEDIEQRLKRFSGLLDESLEAASVRAREVARLVSESSADGSRAISEQYEIVRENAEGERQRAADAMRQILEHSSNDTHSIFRDTAQRFAETVQDMKQMAAEMQREMETTRQELRRGVFELPQETAEGAAQMRRVIVDQIEALAELNRIVARHGRNLDAVEPVMRRAQEPTLAVIGGRNEAPSRMDTRLDMAPPAPPPRPAAPPQRPEVANFAPAARRAEAPSLSPANTQAPNNAGRGWLSDLLTRASRDEAEPPREVAREQLAPAPMPRENARVNDDRTPRHSIESLDSLSVDIARMIDHDAAADLWDRYKRGERNVFTRRLYTLQGQQAFDEIRRKYRSDREFKQTVDRYIGEFERLLEEVSRDDRGQVVARTYLTSETGKVYTMLAHAAGRFD